jgi:hypothetical protein
MNIPPPQIYNMNVENQRIDQTIDLQTNTGAINAIFLCSMKHNLASPENARSAHQMLSYNRKNFHENLKS